MLLSMGVRRQEGTFPPCELGPLQGRIRGVVDSPALKPTKVTSFTMILCNSENSIRDIRPFCRKLFCHSSVVKYISPAEVNR